jgi:hypothetical protein
VVTTSVLDKPHRPCSEGHSCVTTHDRSPFRRWIQAQPSTTRAPIAVPAWAWALALLTLFGLYLIAQDNGAVLASMGETAHEFFHDARHSLGMPCH